MRRRSGAEAIALDLADYEVENGRHGDQGPVLFASIGPIHVTKRLTAKDTAPYWRIPSSSELDTIVDYTTSFPSVSAAFNSGCVASCTVTSCSLYQCVHRLLVVYAGRRLPA